MEREREEEIPTRYQIKVPILILNTFLLTI